jgi:hypothetical protein
MKRFFGVLVVACALLPALAASPAVAGGLPIGGTPQQQSLTNSTNQENEAGAVNVPIASGNNVAILSEGSQSNSAGVSQNQENENTTNQHASQTGSACTTSCTTSSCSDSCGRGCPDSCSGQDQSVRNRTRQENEAFVVNAPVLSGNNVAILSEGSQWNSAGVSQNQENENSTEQHASQSSTSGSCTCCDGQHQSVRNRTSQENEAFVVNAPVLSGNNVAVLSEGSQTNSAGVVQNQENENATRQGVSQV